MIFDKNFIIFLLCSTAGAVGCVVVLCVIDEKKEKYLHFFLKNFILYLILIRLR